MKKSYKKRVVRGKKKCFPKSVSSHDILCSKNTHERTNI